MGMLKVRIMSRKRRPTKLSESGALLVPSSALLDNHFEKLLETMEEIRGMRTLLKALPIIH